MDRVENLKRLVLEKPLLVLGFSLLYLLFIFGVYTYMFNGNPFLFYDSFPAWYTFSATVLNLVISFLGGLAITAFIVKIQELHVKSAGIGIVGLVLASLAAGCPGCFFGLFPIVLGFFGITGTLAILPLKGVELQVVTVVLLGVSLYLLSGETDLSCELPSK